MKRRFKGWWIAGALGVLLMPLLSSANHQRLNAQLVEAAEKGSPEIVAALLDKGAEVSTRNRGGDTPLHYAALGSGANIFLLVRHGANVNAVNNKGETPLHYAIMDESPNCVRALIKSGANVNARCLRFGMPLKEAKGYLAWWSEKGDRARGNMKVDYEIIRILKAASAKE